MGQTRLPALSFFASFLAVSASGCASDVTQMVACLYVEAGSLARAETLHVSVRSLDGAEVRSWDFPAAEVDFPARIPLVPGPSSGYQVVAELREGGAPFSVQRVRGEYVDGALVAQRLFFYDACADMGCGDEEACTLAGGAATCVSWDRPAVDVEGDTLEAACPPDGGCPDCGGRCQSCVDGVCMVKPDGAACGPCADDVCAAGDCVVASPVTDSAEGMSASARHTCVIVRYGTDDQGMFCFGANDRGQLGLGTMGDPVPVPSREAEERFGVRSVGAGESHTCLVVFDGPLYCVGDGTRGQLGVGATTPTLLTTSMGVDRGRDWRRVSSGGDRSCATDRDSGLMLCWGGAANPECSAEDVLAPEMFDGRVWSRIALGASHACGISGRSLGCWGDDGQGQVSGAPGAVSCAAVDVGGMGELHDVAVGGAHSCAIRDEMLLCFGSDAAGQLGDGPGGGTGVVELGLPSEIRPIRVAAGRVHTCALDFEGRLYCWGGNERGQLGAGAVGVGAEAPTAVSGRFDAVVAGEEHTCATDDEGRLYCWGANDFGQLGTGDFEDRDRPTRVCIPEDRRGG